MSDIEALKHLIIPTETKINCVRGNIAILCTSCESSGCEVGHRPDSVNRRPQISFDVNFE